MKQLQYIKNDRYLFPNKSFIVIFQSFVFFLEFVLPVVEAKYDLCFESNTACLFTILKKMCGQVRLLWFTLLINDPLVLVRDTMLAFVIKHLQEIAYHSNRKLYTCEVDLTAAYDNIHRDFLLSSIRNRFSISESTKSHRSICETSSGYKILNSSLLNSRDISCFGLMRFSHSRLLTLNHNVLKTLSPFLVSIDYRKL